jgi:putative redox protein
MKVKTTWNEKMRFTTQADQHALSMDTKPPIGNDTAPTPKQLVIAAICGCTGMDIVALLKKFKQPLESFTIEAETTLTEGSHPIVFKAVKLDFELKGNLDKAKVLEAITLSQTKYCSISAMMSKAVPITYTVKLNDESIGSGLANFS